MIKEYERVVLGQKEAEEEERTEASVASNRVVSSCSV